MQPKVTSPATKGIFISLILIVYSLVTYFTGQTLNDNLKWLGTAIFFVAIIMSCISYAKQLNGNLTFGNDFAHGFKTAAAVTAIMCLYTIIFFMVIAPDMKGKILDVARQKMIEQKNLTGDQIDQGVALVSKLFYIVTVGSIILIYLLCGVIAALIGAAVAKKNPDYIPEQ